MIRSRGMAYTLEKVGYEHIRTINKTDFSMDIENIKKPSKEVLNATKQFFAEIWDKDGRQLAASEAEAYTKKV